MDSVHSAISQHSLCIFFILSFVKNNWGVILFYLLIQGGELGFGLLCCVVFLMICSCCCCLQLQYWTGTDLGWCFQVQQDLGTYTDHLWDPVPYRTNSPFLTRTVAVGHPLLGFDLVRPRILPRLSLKPRVLHEFLRRLLFRRKNEFLSSVFWTGYDPKNTTRTSFLKAYCFRRSMLTGAGVRRRLCEICGSLCSGGAGGKGKPVCFLHDCKCVPFIKVLMFVSLPLASWLCYTVPYQLWVYRQSNFPNKWI